MTFHKQSTFFSLPPLTVAANGLSLSFQTRRVALSAANPLSHVSASLPSVHWNSIVSEITIYIGTNSVFPPLLSPVFYPKHVSVALPCTKPALPRLGNDSHFRGISPPHIRGSHRTNTELAFPFMPCPWDYHIKTTWPDYQTAVGCLSGGSSNSSASAG